MINQSKCKFHNFDTVEKYTLKNDYKPSLLALLSKLTHRNGTTLQFIPFQMLQIFIQSYTLQRCRKIEHVILCLHVISHAKNILLSTMNLLCNSLVPKLVQYLFGTIQPVYLVYWETFVWNNRACLLGVLGDI